MIWKIEVVYKVQRLHKEQARLLLVVEFTDYRTRPSSIV
jgi:hypothetical protein